MNIKILVTAIALVAILLTGASPVLAAKPSQVIPISNGFPSGMHFNLNIHGKDPTTFTTPDPPYDAGNSVFIPEYTAPYGPVAIQCVSNKNGGTEFLVTDPYAMPSEFSNGEPTYFVNADDLAKFTLPYKIQTDSGVINANGYYVYGRILGKPGNSINDGDPSSIILTPNPVLSFSTGTGDLDIALGFVTTNGAYKATSFGFQRFDTSSPLQGKGRSLAQDITDMFMWSGWVCNSTLDLNLDGAIDDTDRILYNAAHGTTYTTVDEWLAALNDPTVARYYEDWWVFDVADIVAQSWGIENDGTKLLQIRFYPVATTTFTEEAHIVVQKVVTDPYGNPVVDTTTLFDFSASYRDSWQMTSNQFCLSSDLTVGSYNVTELDEEGWDLAGIVIKDPSGDSTVAGNTANIILATGETVIVTFTNAQGLILP